MRQKQKRKRLPDYKLSKDKIFLAAELEDESWWQKEIEAVDTLTIHLKATHKTEVKR